MSYHAHTTEVLPKNGMFYRGVIVQDSQKTKIFANRHFTLFSFCAHLTIFTKQNATLWIFSHLFWFPTEFDSREKVLVLEQVRPVVALQKPLIHRRHQPWQHLLEIALNSWDFSRNTYFCTRMPVCEYHRHKMPVWKYCCFLRYYKYACLRIFLKDPETIFKLTYFKLQLNTVNYLIN